MTSQTPKHRPTAKQVCRVLQLIGQKNYAEAGQNLIFGVNVQPQQQVYHPQQQVYHPQQQVSPFGGNDQPQQPWGGHGQPQPQGEPLDLQRAIQQWESNYGQRGSGLLNG